MNIFTKVWLTVFELFLANRQTDGEIWTCYRQDCNSARKLPKKYYKSAYFWIGNYQQAIED
jgi:hypothetical protein